MLFGTPSDVRRGRFLMNYKGEGNGLSPFFCARWRVINSLSERFAVLGDHR